MPRTSIAFVVLRHVPVLKKSLVLFGGFLVDQIPRSLEARELRMVEPANNGIRGIEVVEFVATVFR